MVVAVRGDDPGIPSDVIAGNGKGGAYNPFDNAVDELDFEWDSDIDNPETTSNVRHRLEGVDFLDTNNEVRVRAHEVATKLKELAGETFPPEVQESIERITTRLASRYENFHPDSYTGDTKTRFDALIENDPTNTRELFITGFRDQLHTELNVIEGLLEASDGRDIAVYAVLKYAHVLAVGTGHGNVEDLQKDAIALGLPLSRFNKNDVQTLYEKLVAVGKASPRSFFEYNSKVTEVTKGDRNKNLDAMQEQFNKQRAALSAFISEVDDYLPDGIESITPPIELEAHWSEHWFENFLDASGDVYNPKTTGVQEKGSILFIPISKISTGTHEVKSQIKTVIVETNGISREVQVPFLQEIAIIPVHAGRKIGEGYTGKGFVVNDTQHHLSFNGRTAEDSNQRLEQYNACIEINGALIAQLSDRNPPISNELKKQLAWAYSNGEGNYFLMPIKNADGTYSAEIISRGHKNTATKILRKTLKQLSKYGITVQSEKDAIAKRNAAALKEDRVRQRIERYMPTNSTYVEMERTGNLLNDLIDRTASRLRGDKELQLENTDFASHVETVKANIDKIIGNFLFLYGKGSYYDMLAAQRIAERLDAGLIDPSLVENESTKRQLISIEKTRIHAELTFQAMVLKNLAADMEAHLGEDSTYKLTNLDFWIDSQWRRRLEVLSLEGDPHEVDSRLLAIYENMALRGEPFNSEGLDFTALSDALTIAGIYDSHSIDRVLERNNVSRHNRGMDRTEQSDVLIATILETTNTSIAMDLFLLAIKIIEFQRDFDSNPSNTPRYGSSDYYDLIEATVKEIYISADMEFEDNFSTDDLPSINESAITLDEFVENLDWAEFAQDYAKTVNTVVNRRDVAREQGEILRQQYLNNQMSPGARALLQAKFNNQL